MPCRAKLPIYPPIYTNCVAPSCRQLLAPRLESAARSTAKTRGRTADDSALTIGLLVLQLIKSTLREFELNRAGKDKCYLHFCMSCNVRL